MLRITAMETPTGTTLRLEGRVIGPWVDELRRCCTEMLQRTRCLTLDLGGVGFVDPTGVALLHALRDQAIELSNTSAFVAEQLRG